MINLKMVKKNIENGKIENYIDSFLTLSSSLETVEKEWLKGNVDSKEFNEILDLSDFLAWEIAKYHIENC